MRRRLSSASAALAVGALTSAVLAGCSAPAERAPAFASVEQLEGSSAIVAHVRVSKLLDDGIVDVRVVDSVPVDDGIDAPTGSALVLAQPHDAPEILNHHDYLLFLRPTSEGVYQVTGGAQGMWMAPEGSPASGAGIVFEHADHDDSALPDRLSMDDLRH